MIRKVNAISLIIGLVIFRTCYAFAINESKDSSFIIDLNNQARTFMTIGNDSSFILLDSALQLSNLNKNKYLLGISYKNKGIGYYFKGSYHKALDNYEKGLNYFKIINDLPGIASIYNNLAIIYQIEGEFEKSVETHLKALGIYEKLNDRYAVARSLTNIGNVYGVMGNHNKAIEYQEKSLQLYISISDTVGISNVLNNLGSEYSALSNYQEAYNKHERALFFRKKLNDKNAIATSLLNFGIANMNLEKLNVASELLKEALEIGQKTGNLEIQITALESLSGVAIKMNNRNEALSYLSKAELISKQNKLTIYRRNVYQSFTNLFLHFNDTSKAYLYFNKYIDLNDSIDKIENSKNIAKLEIEYETVKKEKEIEGLRQQKLIDQLTIQRRNRLILIVVFALLIVAVVIWLRFQNYRKQQTINRQKLMFQKIETEQKMLRSQMNPHFIYNSLNSIQSFISSEKSYEAEKYLARFAKLMRGILENSREDLIGLDKEIEVLELYLELEQLRFENRFLYNIVIDENLEPDFVSIPPMMVQPFVENAILHGLKTKSNGQLNVTFSEKENFLVCEVDDNGIGRQNTSDDAGKKHKSLATTITNERLSSISEQYKTKAYFNIIDKINPESNEPEGTIVRIYLPIIDG